MLNLEKKDYILYLGWVVKKILILDRPEILDEQQYSNVSIIDNIEFYNNSFESALALF